MVKGRITNEVERGAKESTAGTYKKGLWTSEEDNVLLEYVKVYGKGKWNRIPSLTGLKRCGKSCRLRWMNYLSPSVKKGDFSQEEDDLIIRLHKLLGNRWALIAGRVPGRTDNQVKNYWNTHLSKKLGVKARKCKSIQTLSHPQQDSTDKTIHSNVTPFMKHSESRGPIEEHKCVDYVTDMSFEEFPSKEEGSLTEEKHNSQGSLVLSTGDDDLIVNNQSLLDFLSEYSLDYVWNNSL